MSIDHPARITIAAGWVPLADRLDVILIRDAFERIIGSLGVEILGRKTHLFDASTPQGGFTSLLLLAESHAAIHTWPERRVAFVELATCGDMSQAAAFEDGCRNAFGDYHRVTVLHSTPGAAVVID